MRGEAVGEDSDTWRPQCSEWRTGRMVELSCGPAMSVSRARAQYVVMGHAEGNENWARLRTTAHIG